MRVSLCSVCYLQKFRRHVFRRHGGGHVFRLKFLPRRAAFALPGRLPAFPDFIAPIRPSDLHAIVDFGSGPPLPLAYLEADASVAAPEGTAAPLLASASATTPVRDWSPAPCRPELLQEWRGSPRLLDHPSRTCRGRTPRWMASPRRLGDGASAFAVSEPLGIQEEK